MPTEQKTRTLLAQTFLKASAGEDVGSEEEQLQREYEWLKDSSRDPAKAAAQTSGQPRAQSSAQEAASLGSIGSLLDDASKKLHEVTT